MEDFSSHSLLHYFLFALCTGHCDLEVFLIGKDLVLVWVLLLLNRTFDDRCQADYVSN